MKRMNDPLVKYFALVEKSPSLFSNRDAPLRIILDPDEIRAWQGKKRETLKERGWPESWAEIGVILSDPYITVLRDLVEFPDQSRNGYFRIINTADFDNGQSVVIMPFYEGKVLLIHQFRHATRSWHLEFPRGYGEPETSSQQNAANEIFEELNGVIDRLHDLGPYHVNTASDNSNVRLFFAELSEFGEPNANEGIKEIKVITIQDLEEFIRAGEITDGFTIATYTRARLKGFF